MHKGTKQGIRKQAQSFLFAFAGLKVLWQEWNMRLHVIATCLVAVAGFLKHCSGTEWILLILCITLVWTAEAFNTALEYLCDYSCEGRIHPVIKKVKDIAAGAVLLTAAGSILIAVIVFLF